MPRWPMSPLALPSAAALAGLALSLVLVWLATAQPWTGLRFLPPDAAGGLPALASVDAGGPAARAGLRPGMVPVTFGGIALEAADLIEEPDLLPDFTAYDRFIARQGDLAQLLRGPDPLVVETRDGGRFTITLGGPRPVWTLPALFWAQLLVGLFGFTAGGWVLGLRRGGVAESFLFAAGLALMLSAHAAALYSSREIALPSDLFRALSALNHFGALAFGAAMIGLFLFYPVQLVAGWKAGLPAVVLGLWWAANQMRLLAEPVWGFQMPILLALVAILACVLGQLGATRGNPRARAALRWFGLSVVIGAGAFVVTVILPVLLGMEIVLPQGFAFLFFLPIYGGLALGVARYRLFELEDWAFRILFYMIGMILLVSLDAVLIALIAMERAPAFGLSLLLVALFYLPLRERLARHLLRHRDRPQGPLFRAITDVALTPPGQSRIRRWQDLLVAEFDPLAFVVLDQDPSRVRLAEDGAALELPGIDTIPPLRLNWARGGRALFSARDLTWATELHAMLAAAVASRRAYETGVAEERARIARDMHDNIGIQLMGALHSGSAERKDVLIRETLSDLREIIANADRAAPDLEEMLADLRAALGDLLAASGITLDWRIAEVGVPGFASRIGPALRSILREAVGNAARHSGAARVAVVIGREAGGLRLVVEDDGRGLGPGSGTAGHGLGNIRHRAEGMGGRADIGAGAVGGTRVEVFLPLPQEEAA